MGKRRRQMIKLAENAHFSDEFEQMLAKSGITRFKGNTMADGEFQQIGFYQIWTGTADIG